MILKQTFKKLIVFTLIFSFLALFQSIEVKASSFGSFSVQAIIPENQVDKSKTYFDLRMKPSDRQVIQILVRNGSDETILAHALLNDAKTGRNGIVVYDGSVADRDSSLKLSTSDVATILTPTIEIGPKGQGYIDIELNMPKKSFDGILLGGIIVNADLKDAIDSSNNEGIQISNEFAYNIGLQLSESDNVVIPELKLGTIKPGLINYRTAVSVNLQNPESILMKDVMIEAEVYKKDSSQIFRELKLTNAEIAPNSNFDIVVDWQGSILQSGEYRLHLKATYQDKNWEWDESFTIKSEDADLANDEAVSKKQDNTIIMVGVVVLGAIFLVFLAFLLGKYSNRNK